MKVRFIGNDGKGKFLFDISDDANFEVIKKCMEILQRPDVADLHPRDIICRDDYVAVKLWMEDDVKEQLLVAGYNDSDDNVAEVLNSGELRALNDCTDSDWAIIDDAITDVSDRLKPLPKYASDFER